MKKIGEHLVERGLVSKDALSDALAIQENSGSKIGHILQAEGIISSYRFFQEFAKFKNLEFVNLEERGFNRAVLVSEEKAEYQEMQYVPFDVIDKIVYVATTNPTDELKEYLDRKFTKYKFFITSPFDILWTLQKRFDEEYSEHASEHLFENIPFSSSKFVMDSWYSKIVFLSGLAAICYLLTNHTFMICFLFLMNVFFLCSIISRVIFYTTGLLSKNQINNTPKLELEDKEFPVYSILVPLYQEKYASISNLINAIKSFDYPNDKLDIKLICEVNDSETINTIKNLRPSSNYQIIKVPDLYPKTKPKACNYALNFCKGEFVTIYDAEDVPEPGQLKKVLAKFYNPSANISCVQARLNYYNREENILTKLFSIEYSSWFDFILFGLQKLNLPIPLGGTSNHFKIKMLKSLYAWDPYNVTEDADLGVRLSLAGLKTEMVDSITLEEAPVSLSAWLHQRTRRIKGYFQTYIVQMREPTKLLKNLGFLRFLGFFFFVCAPGIIYLTAPIVLVLTTTSLMLDINLPEALVGLSYFNLKFTVLLNLAIAGHIIYMNKWKGMLDSLILFPFYWILHCLASFSGLYELLVKPHHWNKTEHNVSKMRL